MISRPLREDTHHAAAAVVGMRDAYRSFQAEVVGQKMLKLGLREGEGFCQHSTSFTAPMPPVVAFTTAQEGYGPLAHVS